ncbi:MAG TPA: hypothetical protein PK275_11295 [Chitinophagaceae bacterium]|nr:hypothetical protein [Chitinophagaceae bacterium]
MDNLIINNYNSLFNSRLSFKPLLDALRHNINSNKTGLHKLYNQVIASFDEHPELLGPIDDLSILAPYEELIQELLSAVFPPTTANQMYGVSLPFNNAVIFSSPIFKRILVDPVKNELKINAGDSAEELKREGVRFAYNLLLKKIMNFSMPENSRFVIPFTNQETGQTRYYELRLDGRFIDIKPSGEMPELPSTILNPQTGSLMSISELMEKIPLTRFVFEGIMVIRVNDTTEAEAISKIKNRLLENNALSDAAVYNELEGYIQSLIGLKNLSIGVTPFFKINNHYVYSDLHNSNSILFRHLDSIAQKDEISDYCKILFRENGKPVLYETLTNQALSEIQCLQYYYKEGARSVILCPLQSHDGMIGLLEIVSKNANELKPQHITKLEEALPLFARGLEKSLNRLNGEVDAIIKKKFTAVQPAVEWRFTEAALNFIVNKHTDADVRIERIAFNEVFPLYGAIDIRSSSTERGKAIQADLIAQLQLAQQVVEKTKNEISFPLLDEIEFKLKKFIASATGVLQSDEELNIQDFLRGPAQGLFCHLQTAVPEVSNEIAQYLSVIDPQVGMLYHYRKMYEQSVSKINDTLARFIDKEQMAAQKVYPHFFERFITDGLEFNIHIGQSISPRKKFDEIYLHNLKMWQLTVLAKAARLTHKLENHLPHKLRTAQLILVHGQPLSITFRTEERKFDVDGAYNTRYEIIKKRIDKAYIRNTNERLTQPGKIAIVYSQSKDAAEYAEYIEFLQGHLLLKSQIEYYELEEMQGVVGLKAMRVEVNFEDIDSKNLHSDYAETNSSNLTN